MIYISPRKQGLTLAEIKRRATVGARVTLYYHKHAESWKEPARSQILAGTFTRKIQHAQGNAIQFEAVPGKNGDGTFSANGTQHGSWLWWPKASEIRIDGPDAWTVLENGEAFMSYRFELG